MTRLCVISDTHGQHRAIESVPDGDVLISCGDETNKGEISILTDFISWMKSFPHAHKILIFGNHSLGLEHPGSEKRIQALKMIKDAGIIYLEDSGVEIDGLHYFGSPVTPRFFDWAWNRDRGSDIKKHWDMIPNSTNVLITHGPIHGILDEAPRGFGSTEHIGCEDLANRVWELKNLKAHLFGHVHMCGSSIQEEYGIKFVNAAICTEAYRPTNLPVVIDV